MQTLRKHRADPHNIYLQRLLNAAFTQVRDADVLDEDNDFGNRTEALLIRFQSEYRGPLGRLTADGIAGQNTWRALGLQVEISHPLPMVGQNTAMSCWVVAAGLATGRMSSDVPSAANFQPVNTPYTPVMAPGGLAPDLNNLTTFARELRMRLHPMVPMTVEQLEPVVQRGPAILVGRWVSGGLHAIVISGFFSAGTPFTRMIRINNPAPMGRGSISVTDYPNMALVGGPFDPYALITR